MVAGGVGDGLGFAGLQRVVAAHRTLQFGELSDHGRAQVQLGQARGAFGLIGIGADQGSDLAGQGGDAFDPVGEGMSATGAQLLVSTVIAFVVGFAAVSWFLRFLARHSMYWFVGYRIVLGCVVLMLLGTGVVAAT